MKGRNRHSVSSCKTARQFHRAVNKQGGYAAEGGRHTKLYHPAGGSVAVPRHSGDIATGTRASIVRGLLALGFLAVLLICLIVVVAQPVLV